MIYLDTSCVLTLIRDEPGRIAVDGALAIEERVCISGIVELESLVDLKAGYTSGDYTKSQWRRFEFELHNLRNLEPFEFRAVPSSVWEAALRQHRNLGEIHCRTLDRLHLATAEKFGLNRLMTRDLAQAAAARDLGFTVIQPGR